MVNIAEKAAGFAITRPDVGTESGVSVTVDGGHGDAERDDGDGRDVVGNGAGGCGAISPGPTSDGDGRGVEDGVHGRDAGDADAHVGLGGAVVAHLHGAGVVAGGGAGDGRVAIGDDGHRRRVVPTPRASRRVSAIDTGTGLISGTPTTANAGTSSVTVTITDDAGNETTVSLTFPAVSKGVQDLSGFGYAPPRLTFGDSAPSLTAPADPKGAVTYSATPSSVCTVNTGTGALAIVAAGTCEVEATAAATPDYEAASAPFTVTVTEPDVPGIRLTETMLDVPRGGTATYGVKLTVRPTSNVTVRIAGIAGTDLTVTDANGVDLGRGNAGLTFTTEDWEVDQHVTVAAEGDADAADYEVTITHRASGTDLWRGGGVVESDGGQARRVPPDCVPA